MRRSALRRVRALAQRLPLTRSELSYVVETVRRELGRPEHELEVSPQPRWRRRLDRELHDEMLDELLRLRKRRRR